MHRALAFLTPFGPAAPPTPGALTWFPAVGALIGLAVGGTWWAANQLWHPLVAAGLAVGADLVLTGLLHFDGLVDTADGVLPPLSRSRRLDVMAEPGAGAFGVGVAVVVLLLRWASLATQRVSVPLVGGLWCASRTVMALVVREVPYARPGGLAGAFGAGGGGGPGPGGGPPGWAIAGVGLAGAAVLAGLGRGGPGLVALLAAVVIAGLVVLLAVRRVGGFTGDVLGAAGLVGETAGLVVAAARW